MKTRLSPALRTRSARLLVAVGLVFAGVLAFSGGATAQANQNDLELCVPSPSSPTDPRAFYYTHGPGTFGWDGTALTIVGADAASMSRWMTNTTAIGDGECAGSPMPVHGGGIVGGYTFMRTENVDGGYAIITLTFWNEQVQFIGSADGGRISGTTDWTPVGFDTQIPAGTKYIRIEYRLNGLGKLWIGRFTGSISYPIVVRNLTPPAVSGIPEVGETLQASGDTWDIERITVAHVEWLRCDGAGQDCQPIAGAGGSERVPGADRYVVRPEDVGSTIRVRVRVGNDSESSDWATSAPTPVVRSNASELAPDAGFEADPGPFYFTYGPGTFSWASDAAHTGTHALKIVSVTGELARWLSTTQAIPVTPGSTYDVTAWLKTQGAQASARLSVNFWTAGGVYIPATTDAASLVGTQDWTPSTLHLTAPAGAAFLRVEFRLNGPGTLWADDVSVTR
jgi:hypothetical protein